MHMKSQPEIDNSDQWALARARRFLDDQGIDAAAIIHGEDATRMMVRFFAQEQEQKRQMHAVRRPTKKDVQQNES
jgi:hypothetical protein